MKKSKKVTLVLMTAALASCNRYLAHSHPQPAYSQGKEASDSCTTENVYTDPAYDPWYGLLMSQWIYAFNPYAYNYYYYGHSRRTRVGHFQNGHWIHRFYRTGVLRGGWGRSAQTTVNS